MDNHSLINVEFNFAIEDITMQIIMAVSIIRFTKVKQITKVKDNAIIKDIID
jgi:hypothetical protein